MMGLEISSVVVVGAGTMGAGIAQWFAQQGLAVTLTDATPTQLEKALAAIHGTWDKLVEKQKLTPPEAQAHKDRLRTAPPDQLPATAGLVVEAIYEDKQAKLELFARLDAHFPPGCVFASNTSSFPITALAQSVAPERRRRFVGLHFFNPAPLMKLVEVISAEASDRALAAELAAWFRARGKEPALCADTPGFIVNRVARSFYGEALRIVGTENEGLCREVDQLLREVGGFKMGPFELMDLIGVDVNYAVTCSVWEALGHNARFTPHPLQKQLVDEGRHGKKTKRGFYDYR